MTPLTPAQQQLVASNVELVNKEARRMSFRLRTSFDDLRGAAQLGLVEAARTYEPTAGKTFPEYARFRIRGRMIDLARHNARQAKLAMASAGYYALADVDRGGNPLTDGDEEIRARLDASFDTVLPAMLAVYVGVIARGDFVDALERRAEHQKAIRALDQAMSRLRERDRTIVQRLFVHEQSMPEVATAMSLTLKQVRIAKEQALRLLAEQLKALGIEAAPESTP